MRDVVVLLRLKGAPRAVGLVVEVSVKRRVFLPITRVTSISPGQVISTGLLNVPLRYMHTPCEVLSLSDLEATARLLAACCRRITPDTDFTPR